LAGIEESNEIKGVLLLLNTVGGDIEAGLAIAEMIAGMKKPTVSLVLGGGHSIGIPLAVCTKKSFITPTASMTTPCTTSMQTISHFRLHLSTILPQNGDRNIVTNIEIEDMTPISALDPVAWYTQYPIAILYITSPIVLTAFPCSNRMKSLFHSFRCIISPPF
jgi:hypothetical protein